MATTQLSKLDRIAKNYDNSASVTYSKRHGYALEINGDTTVLGKDSIAAFFRLEQILEKLKSYAPLQNRSLF